MNKIINMNDNVEISMQTYNDVCEIYKLITRGAYHCPEDGYENVADEFKFCFGYLAELALDLEDKMDELFQDCTTPEDCKDRLYEYFLWDEYK